MRAFRSELTKLRGWSVLAGVPAMVAVAVGLSYFGLSPWPTRSSSRRHRPFPRHRD